MERHDRDIKIHERSRVEKYQGHDEVKPTSLELQQQAKVALVRKIESLQHKDFKKKISDQSRKGK